MDLSRRLCSTALVAFIVLAGIHDSQSRFPGLRQKRQYGANMYLPESSVTPGGEGNDPDEWTPWSSPSDCSRTCGGGVSYQTRECLRRDYRGEAVCSGGSRRYFSCNTQDCPEDEPDFRAQQCSRFDRQKFDGVLYEWVPYTNAPNPCELNCMPKGERFYYRQREKVVDGTRCNDKDLDVCVNGECMPVGCDMMLGSNAKEDKCRKCGGDGSTCKTIRNNISTKDLAPGYNDLLLLPQGATNIRIEEPFPSSNYLACRNHSGHYYLNGDWRIDFPRPMFFANSWWNYQRKPMGFAAPDQLTSSGPISESLFIVMLVQDKNISLDYEYSIPESLTHAQQDTHTWTHHQFSACSASCGGGTQSRKVTCNNRITLAEVSAQLCDQKSKPVEEQECGTDPCAPHWVEGEWSKCSKGCGSDGFQNRSITCERISSTGEKTVEEDAVCLQQVGNKPATTQECNRDVKNCPKYHLGPWSPCDKLCGEGKQTRKVTCYIKENGRKRVLPEEDCVEEKPEAEKTCLLTPCEGVDWIISQWSGCNACGQNTETRTAICGNKEGKVYPEEFCEPEVPTLSRPCKSPKCEAQWFSSEWSKCSAACGKGVKSRIVICGEFDGKTVTPASDDSKCNKDTKPEQEQECEGEEKVCPGEWFTGPWGKCSKPCGGGERVREVLCLSNGTKSVNCDEEKVEPLSEKCNPEACTEDEILPLTSTDKPIEDDEEDCDEDGIELVGDNLPEVDKKADIIDFEVKSDKETTPEAEELMQSDSPTPYDESESTGTTVEGSGDDSESTTDSGISTEGSGDDEDTSEASTDLLSSTTSDSSSSESSSSDSSISSDATSEAPSSVSDSSDSIDQSTEPTAVSGESTDSSSSTEASASDSTDVTGSSDASDSTDTTESSGSTDASDSTPEGSTESSSSTDDSTDSSDKTSDVSESSTEASSSSVSDSSDTTDGSTDGVSSSTESSSDKTSDASSESTVSSDSTDSTSDETTETTPESSTDTTESSTLDSSSTSDASSSSESSSESSTDSSASSSTSNSEATDSTNLSSDGSTTDASTVDASTESSTEGATDGSTDRSTDDATDETTDGATDASTDGSSDNTTDGSSDDTTLSTDSSGSTESTEAGASEGSTTEGSSTSSDNTSDSTATESSSSTDVSGSTEASESSSTDVSSSEATTDATESTESTASGETSDTTESGPTEESTTEGSTDSSTEGSTESTQSTDLDSTTSDIWSSSDKDDDSETSTPYSFESEVGKIKPRKCKPKKSDCVKSEYGCCPDGKSTPKGPFDEGCPIAKTCADTKYGCCLDGVSPAKGKNNKGCPKSQCAETLFGCCPDKFTAAEGEDDEGCPETTTVPSTTTTEESQPESTTEIEGSGDDSTTSEPETKSCSYSEFGCCADAETPAKGADFAGCPEVEEPKGPKGCGQSEHGCCPDGQTAASGPNGEGCSGCTRERYGCCPDSQTPAHGPNKEGCCLDTEFGCCPDNILAARGPNNEGCECHYTPYGCCPDNKSAATGYNQEGCACETTQHGCCPDKITAAKGPKFEGCPCETTQFGCCPDGITFAKGPHHHGCHCTQTEFKCCDDEKTPAKGPNGEGCTCVESKFGCCPDGITKATDEKFGGCENVEEPPQKACALPKETGTCSNFSVKYYFDTSYGGCARFWYGGCDGNDNRFESEAECKDTCQDYTGKHVCLLPKSSGPCTGYTKKWYFDADRNRCEEFQYGGCYGTNNRFDTLEQCQGTCASSENLPTCEQPVESGPCAGNFERWYYDNQTDICRPFTYGGCKGNRNNYPTEHACNYNCRQPGVLKDHCALPKQTGDCSEKLAKWYFSENEKRCVPFYYTGCGGNKNNFPSLESCEDHCPRQVAKDICEIPAEVGECANYVSSWYYDTKDQACRQFYYGGCGGNENRFTSEESCLARCDRKPEPTTTTAAPKPDNSRQDVCDEEPAAGECSDWVLKWHFDRKYGGCRQFYYGGCGGNGNRFETESDCQQRCSRQERPAPTTPRAPAPTRQPPQPAPPAAAQCDQPTDPGQCDEWVLNWSYNQTAGQCQSFYYGGCGGNENRFGTEEECSSRCSPNIDTRFGNDDDPPEEIRPESDTSKCFLAPELGNCFENETRWFYNSQEGLCDEFIYTGCGGNANNYASEEECQTECNDAQTTCALPPVRGRCSDLSRRWYFDERSGGCHEFEFTGCRGNRNNFVSENDCLRFCREQGPVDPEPPQAPTDSVCSQPPEAGECDNRTTAWFYDNENMACTAFTYTGCGGNGNRFETRDQCERQCGEFKGVDVCNEAVTSGPCTDWQTKYFFNKASQACEPFTYGGCDGTGNRFNDLYECQTVCLAGREPTVGSAKEICLLPVLTGRCNGPSVHERRWYYDDSLGNCVSFIYAGCSGNQNNFRSFEACMNQCRPDTNDQDNGIGQNPCDNFDAECREIRCPYGVRRVAAQSQPECTQCVCENPCEGYDCPEGQKCAIDVASSDDRQFAPLCREINKPGECPALSANASGCARECYTDADCRGDTKCCSDGCGQLCIHPARPTQPPRTQAPVVAYPGDVRVALEPKERSEVDVQTSIGGIAVLRCFATGNPAPNITWSLNNLVINTNKGRYVLTSNGDLTIVQVRQTDDGTYVCVASNGLGEPVRREVALQVTEAVNLPAYVYGDKNVTQIVQLNRPAVIRCPAGGHPKPHVSWWRNGKMFGLNNNLMARDYSLVFNSIQLTDLGLYTCEVFNYRRPVSLRVTLKAVGPVRALSLEEEPYLQYVLNPATPPVTQRPRYPFRPTRPAYVPEPTVNVHAVLALDSKNSYAAGSTIAMSCSVQGYPEPNVTWTKDEEPLYNNERVQITSQPHRLVLSNVNPEDSGKYTCRASNAYTYANGEANVTIQSFVPVSPECVDNPYFANCKLIVHGRYCSNPYYSKFCCRSCTLAGQVATSFHPNAV